MRAAFVMAMAASLPAIGTPARAQVKRVWLTHGADDPGLIVVNWTTARPGDSLGPVRHLSGGRRVGQERPGAGFALIRASGGSR